MKLPHTLLAALGCLCILTTALPAQVPYLLSYQGRLAVGDPPVNFNGPGSFKFALVDGGTNPSVRAAAEATLTGSFVTAYTVTNPGLGYTSPPSVSVTGGGGSGATATAVLSGGSVVSITPGLAGTGYTSKPTVTISLPAKTHARTFWSNDGTSAAGSEPSAEVSLEVTKGLYSVLLGDTAPPLSMAPIPASVFANPDVRLRVWFSDNLNDFQQLSPDQRLAPNGYLPDGAISSAKLAIGAVTTANLAPGLTLEGTTAGNFSGDGSRLTGLQAASLTGDLTFTLEGNAGPLGSVPENDMGNGTAFAVAISGSYACLANGSGGLRIIDLSDPQSPVLKGHVPESLMGNSFALGVTVAGGFAYVSNYTDGLRIIDLSDPQTPVLRGHLAQPPAANSYAFSVAVAGSYAYLANTGGGLRIIDVSNPENPVLVSEVLESQMDPVGEAYGVAVVGTYAYLANGFDGFRIIDISNPQNPLLRGHIEKRLMGGGLATGIAVSGSFAYLANGLDGLEIIDISHPQTPVVVGLVVDISGVGVAFGVTVSGPYAYLANGGDGLRVIDISVPSAPVRKSHVPQNLLGNSFARNVAVSGSRACVANTGAGLRIVGLASARAASFAGDGGGLTLGGTSLATLLEGKVSKAGDTMTGNLTLATGKVGIGREAAMNALEVQGEASKEFAGTWLANSDRRIKEDIQPIGHALETLDRVRLVDFRYTEDYRAAHPGIPARRYLNVVAQEFAEVFPDHVKSSGEKLADGSAILQVDTYPLTIYSAAAVQELHTKLKARDAELAEVKKESADVKARLEKLETLLLKGAAQ